MKRSICYKNMIKERLERQGAFFNSKEQGDILIYCNTWSINRRTSAASPLLLESFFIKELENKPVGEICNDKDIRKLICSFLKNYGQPYKGCYEMDQDYIPIVEVCFGMVSITAAMSGKKAKIASDTSWCKPAINKWEDIEKLKLDSQNRWVQFATKTYIIFLKYWKEDDKFTKTVPRYDV